MPKLKTIKSSADAIMQLLHECGQHQNSVQHDINPRLIKLKDVSKIEITANTMRELALLTKPTNNPQNSMQQDNQNTQMMDAMTWIRNNDKRLLMELKKYRILDELKQSLTNTAGNSSDLDKLLAFNNVLVNNENDIEAIKGSNWQRFIKKITFILLCIPALVLTAVPYIFPGVIVTTHAGINKNDYTNNMPINLLQDATKADTTSMFFASAKKRVQQVRQDAGETPSLNPIQPMKTLEEKCSELSKGEYDDTFRHNGDRERHTIAKKLARLLLDADAVNTRWCVKAPYPGTAGTEGIVNFLQYIDDNDLIGQLLAKGLDLNQEHHSGILPFTWFIGNAQNDLVDKLLTSAEQNQTLEQRLVWINRTDTMTRKEPIETDTTALCFEIFSSYGYGTQTKVGQTPLQLAIAKGYTDKSGSGVDLNVSNLQIAGKLLRLGADQQINYQEPTRGNTALHIAYARRDYQAIQLLEEYGASQNIRNKDGETPADMLSLSFSQVEKLMKFHTSPDSHPRTFRLEQREFDNTQNLRMIYDCVKLERQFIEVNGKETKLPSNQLSFNKLESAAIEGEYDTVSLLVNSGANLQKAMESIQHRIELLKFINEDAPLHLQNMPWRDYVNKRQTIDDKYNGISNPYMYDINETGYTSFQNYVNNNKDEVIASTEKAVHDISTFISQLEGGLILLEKIILKEYAKKADTNHVEQLITNGIDTQIITISLQQELAALHFKKTLGSLALPLYTNQITWDNYSAQMEQAYEKAGGHANHYLPNRKYQLDKDRYEEIKAHMLSGSDAQSEDHDFIKKVAAEIDSKILTCERALNLIETAVRFGKDKERCITSAQQAELKEMMTQVRSGGEETAPVDSALKKEM